MFYEALLPHGVSSTHLSGRIYFSFPSRKCATFAAAAAVHAVLYSRTTGIYNTGDERMYSLLLYMYNIIRIIRVYYMIYSHDAKHAQIETSHREATTLSLSLSALWSCLSRRHVYIYDRDARGRGIIVSLYMHDEYIFIFILLCSNAATPFLLMCGLPSESR